MKFFIIFIVFQTMCSTRRSLALIEDHKTYERMSFDLLVRGSWWLDHCAKNLLNCHEIIKPDVICTHSKYFSSACAVHRDYCHILDGMRDDYKHTFHLYEQECLHQSYEQITRRLARQLRLASPALLNNNTIIGNTLFITSKAS